METEFTPLSSLIGGMLIGLSAVIFLITNGRIAGISGIISRLLPPSIHKPDFPQGLLFLTGLILSIPTWYFINGSRPVQFISENYLILSIAGLVSWFRSCARKWLYKWSWCLWDFSFIYKIYNSNWYFYDDIFHNGSSPSTFLRNLNYA